jgi:hypothetical protein
MRGGMDADLSGWSGDGDLTTMLVEVLKNIPGIAAIRVEDAPSSRSDTSYMFLSNEVFLGFDELERLEPARWLGVIPARRRVRVPALTLLDVEALLARHEEIGAADYRDTGMLQYLRSQRIIPPYQTRGYKLVEMVRIYGAGRTRAPAPEAP